MILRYIYTIFLAVLIVTFVGVGIAAFYPSPKSPEYPIETAPIAYEIDKAPTESAEMRQKRINYEKESRNFQKVSEKYNKDVSTISVAASLLVLILSITLLSKILFISDGLLLGGVFTLMYSIIRGFGTGDEKFRFVVVTIGLVVAIFLGYWRFVRTEKNTKKKK